MASDARPADSAGAGPRAPGRPLSRAEQQARTRTALTGAAELVFARDGFHGASLEVIAREAGYSKGAVYSNFSDKADLFLAVMDRQIEDIDERWAPLSERVSREQLTGLGEVRFDDPPTLTQRSRGFSLATLEFAATAGRDEALMAALRDRLGTLVTAAAGVVVHRRAGHDPLDDEQLGFLVTAFDQGFSLLALVGWPIDDPGLVKRALGRLLQPVEDEVDG